MLGLPQITEVHPTTPLSVGRLNGRQTGRPDSQLFGARDGRVAPSGSARDSAIRVSRDAPPDHSTGSSGRGPNGRAPIPPGLGSPAGRHRLTGDPTRDAPAEPQKAGRNVGSRATRPRRLDSLERLATAVGVMAYLVLMLVRVCLAMARDGGGTGGSPMRSGQPTAQRLPHGVDVEVEVAPGVWRRFVFPAYRTRGSGLCRRTGPSAGAEAVERVDGSARLSRPSAGAPRLRWSDGVSAIIPEAGSPHAAGARGGARIGQLLRAAGALTATDLIAGLHEQALSGGRLGEILVANDVVPNTTLTTTLARQLGVATLRPEDQPVRLLSPRQARTWRAVALDGTAQDDGALAVALADPSPELLAQLEARLERPVEPKLCDEETLDAFLNRVYANDDAQEVTRTLREKFPELSAFRTALSRPQLVAAGVLGFCVITGLLVDVQLTATVLASFGTVFFVASTGFRLYAAWKGCRAGATIDPAREDIARMDQRALPVYTILLPLYKEKPSTVRALFEALSRIDYPKHKLDGLLLLEGDDEQTRRAIEGCRRPPWMRVQPLPPGLPRTKPRAMSFGLRHAKGSLVTVYDAEDKPDPDQLKKAAWSFERADASVACLQAKLGYYNPRQNLLTRWFTLEYDAWFNIFLPGLHRMGAPIPLGGTSNHFRRVALDACLGWDPYNVTEDADLGLRFARLGYMTAMLESTTAEEANSRVRNWLRQRSRWSKGYMQTVIVHTRRPLRLLRELGPKASTAFLLTVGGAVVTALLAPIFWLLLALWIYGQPQWIAILFPGPLYYAASLSLLLGNFLLVFLSVCAAVARGHDDLAPHALLTPIYWSLMSIATYVALVELFVRPSHWHKTEHGLHLAEEPA
jgi:glycosyltransferase XagB